MVDISTKLEKVEQLLKEIKEDLSKKASVKISGIDADAVRKIVKEEISKIDFKGDAKIVLPAPDYILEKFQEAEIRRWEGRLKELDEEHLKVGAFVLALDKQTTRKEVIGRVFGNSYTAGSGYTEKSKILDDLIEAAVLRTDTAKRIYPNVKELIRENLKTYNAGEEKIQNMIDRILRIFITKVDDLK